MRMDIFNPEVANGMYERGCSDYVYQEEVLDYLIKYDNNLQGVIDGLRPECITAINNQFLVAYKKRDSYKVGANVLRGALNYYYSVVPKCYGLLDLSANESIGALQIETIPGLSLTGEEVLIGFVDTGIAYESELFLKNGRTRIRAIWDQTIEAYDSSEEHINTIFGYGREFQREEIQLAVSEGRFLAGPPDESGHGTGMASLAAGNSYETQTTSFRGIAPNADILMVKLKPAKRNLRDYFRIPEDVACYSEADIMLGVKYLINKAMELGKPIVICLGIGTNQGDHNGNLNLEQYLDTIATLRGVCIVTAGGNELGAGGHFSGTVNTDMEIYVEPGESGFCLEIWGNAPNLYRVQVISPTGERFDGLPVNEDAAAEYFFLYEGTRLYMQQIVVEQNSGDPLVFLQFTNPAVGIWKILVQEMRFGYALGFDAWLPMRQFLKGDTRFAQPTTDVTLCAPGTANQIIVVAGYNHKDRALYVRSSRGYTRKGRIKPDFVAPAQNVDTLLARGSTPLLVEKSGTSLAAALTAGAAALLLEWGFVRGNQQKINTEIIRQLFVRGAKQVFDLSYPNPSWGYGLLNVLGTFELLRNR